MAENISVVDPDSGSGYDYASLDAWETAKAADITSATGSTTQETAKCRSTSGTTDTSTNVGNSSSWATDTTNHVKIWTDPAESYRWDGNKYPSSGNIFTWEPAGFCVYCTTTGLQHLIVEGIASEQDFTASNRSCIYTAPSNASAWTRIRKCCFRGDFAAGSPTSRQAINFGTIGTGVGASYVDNNLIYGEWTDGIRYSAVTSDHVHFVYNTIYGTGGAGNATIPGYQDGVYRNNLVNGTWSDPDNGAAHADSGYNAGPTGSDPYGSNDSTGTVSFVSTTAGSEDFHLQSGDTVAQGKGQDLSSYGANFAEDFGGNARHATAPDCGLHEYTAGGTTHEGIATVKGVGVLGTIAAAVIHAASATILGAGLLGTIAAAVTHPASASVTGSGLLGAVAGSYVHAGVATVVGVGALGTVDATVDHAATAEVSASGLLGTADGVVDHVGSATEVGVGVLGTISGVVDHTGIATVVGVGGIGKILGANDALGVVTFSADATVVGVGSLGTVAGSVWKLGEATVVGVGALGTVSGVVEHPAIATVTGYGLLGVVASDIAKFANATVTGYGRLGVVSFTLVTAGARDSSTGYLEQIQDAALATLVADTWFGSGGTGEVATLEVRYPQPGDALRAYRQNALPAVYVYARNASGDWQTTGVRGRRYELVFGVVTAKADAQAGRADILAHQNEGAQRLAEAIFAGQSTWLASNEGIENIGGIWEASAPVQDEDNPHLVSAEVSFPLIVQWPTGQ